MQFAWNEIKKEISTKIPEIYYNSFIDKLEILSSDDDSIELFAPSEKIKEHIEKKYLQFILEELQKKGKTNVKFTTPNNLKTRSIPRQASEKNEIDCDLTFENYCLSETNINAVQAVYEIINQDNSFVSPIYLFGGVGVGKTHILNALALKFTSKFQDQDIVFTNINAYMNEFISSIPIKNELEKFKKKYNNTKLFILDDIHHLNQTAEKSQEELLSIFNKLLLKKIPIIITANRPIHSLGLNINLKSRLQSGLQLEIKPPDYKVRYGIVSYYNKKLELGLVESIESYIAKNVVNDNRILIGAMNDLYFYKKNNGMFIFTEESVNKILESRRCFQEANIDAQTIIHYISEFYSIPKDEILGKSRRVELINPRHVTMYLLSEMLGMKKNNIGRIFKTSHTSVIHAISRIQKIKKTDNKIIALIQEVKSWINKSNR